MSDNLIVVPASIKAILFDCDGTLAETLDIHWNAWLETLQKFDAGEVPLSFLERFNGMPTSYIVEQVNKEFALRLPVTQVARMKDAAITEFLGQVKPIQPVIDLAREQQGKRIIIVLSGGDRCNVEKTLQVIGCGDIFDAVLCGDDDHPPKADPQLYRMIAERFGVSTSECFFIEDAEMPMQAALEAGCMVFDVRTLFGRVS